jgi:hypothetical protein
MKGRGFGNSKYRAVNVVTDHPQIMNLKEICYSHSGVENESLLGCLLVDSYQHFRGS